MKPQTRRAFVLAAMTSLAAAACVGTSKAPHSSAPTAPASSPAPKLHKAAVTTYTIAENGLRERIVTYDPPKHVATGEWLTREVYFSGFPGAPTLVLRMPCTRQCRLPKITKGEWAGRFVSVDGEIITLPPR